MKQVNLRVCRQLVMQLLLDDQKPQFQQYFDKISEDSIASFAAFAKIFGEQLARPGNISTDSYMKGLIMGICMAEVSSAPVIAELAKVSEDFLKKTRGENVIGFHDAVAKKGKI